MRKDNLNPLNIEKYWKNMKPPDLKQLKKENSKFTDKYFPPDTNSLLSKDSMGEYIDKVEGPKNRDELNSYDNLISKLEWKRLSTIDSSWKLFNENKIKSSDVLQGQLGDCYFVGTISALGEYPYLIAEKFRTKEYNDIGYYEIIFFIDGEWQIVFVDDFFPYNNPCKTISFCKPNKDKVIWPLLLEKAWAKINGGYSNIISGESSDPLFVITGFPTDRQNTSENDSEEIFQILEKYQGEGKIMTTSIKNNKDSESYGLVSDHLYSILSVLSKEDQNIYLVKLRNPWGKTDWKGNWSGNSNKWTPELRQYFGYQSSEDGSFWISINDFIYFFDTISICHLMYGSLIKNYFFKKEKYFKSPIVYNIQIKNQADFSISIIFKHWRFNRNNRNPQRPISLLLCKFDSSNEVEELYMGRTSSDDLHLFNKIKAGNYVLWVYCYYEEVKNDPNFFYTLSMKCTSDFTSQFVGFDTDFTLLQKLALSHYNKEFDKERISEKNVHLGSLKKTSEAGLTCYFVCNLSDKWADINLNLTMQNLKVLPPYKGMNTISLTIPPKRKVPIILMRISNEGSSFQISTSTMMSDLQKEVPKILTCSRFFHRNIKEDDNELAQSIILGGYRYVTKDQSHKIPIFKKDEYAPQEILKRSEKKTKKITVESLKKEYPEDMKRVLEFTELFDSNSVSWDKIPSTDGVYIGEVNNTTLCLEGRGIYIWNNGIRYIGYWINGEMNNYGIIYDKDWNKIYDGEYVNGKQEGYGTLTIRKGEYITGKFVNDCLTGQGRYYYSDGSYWEGPFGFNTRNGMGIMTYKNGEQYYILYDFGDLVGKYERVEKEEQRIERERIEREKKEKERKEKKRIERKKLQKEKERIERDKKEKDKKEKERIEKERKERDKKKKDKIEKERLEKERKEREERERNKLNMFFEVKPVLKEKQEMKNIINLSLFNDYFLNDLDDFSNYININNSVFIEEKKETDEEKNQKKIEELKKTDKFMMEQILLLPKLDEKEMFNKIIQDKAIFIGSMINGKLNGRGGLVDGNKYDFGYFKDGFPNGFFRRFYMNKLISFEGVLNKEYSPNYGKLYINDGTRYIGFISSDWKRQGKGLFYSKEGESWTGNFENNLLTGQGKNITENGLLTRDMSYDKDRIISKGNYVLYNKENQENLNFLSQLKQQQQKIYNYLTGWKPQREINNLKWKQITLSNGDIIIGEADVNGYFNGRGCRIFNAGTVKYYIGYFKNGNLDNRGRFYGSDWKIIYDGEFSNNIKNGFGKEYLDYNTTYKGYFINNKFEGDGVLFYSMGGRYEGTFCKGFKHGKGFEILNPPKMKQAVEYKEGNLVYQENSIKCSVLYYQQNINQEFNEIRTKYPEYIELIQNLKETKDYSVLIKGEKYYIEGHYIGEMNTVGFRHGRGILFEPHRTCFYAGYFVCNKKQGYGTSYYQLGSIKYQGFYYNDEPLGKGKYYYTNGDTLEGTLNEIGNGKGTYTYKDGRSWVGNFKLWMKHENDT